VRLIAALSGGVDSAVAAARMVDAGHDVTAVHLALSRNPQLYRSGSRGCCSIEDATDAKRIADVLSIPFYVWDLSQAFEAGVVNDFIAEYAAGRTPNPCLRCNELIKFAAMCDRALALGFDGLVTGHYATLVRRDDGIVEMHRGVDVAKDQSYVLGVMTQEQLQHAHFPLGGSAKTDVRAEAAARGLRVANKPDSYDICFIPDGNTADWLAERLGERPGQIVDQEGVVLGEHSGTYGFTIGQRKGLRLGVPAADGRPRYVMGLDADTRRVSVGPRDSLRVSRFECVRPLWCDEPLTGTNELAVQIRAHSPEVRSSVRVMDDEVLEVELSEPAFGVAPGQSAVFYAGTRVVGSAIIDKTSA
jgi:tRNA-specific 2-thiouridylase